MKKDRSMRVSALINGSLLVLSWVGLHHYEAYARAVQIEQYDLFPLAIFTSLLRPAVLMFTGYVMVKLSIALGVQFPDLSYGWIRALLGISLLTIVCIGLCAGVYWGVIGVPPWVRDWSGVNKALLYLFQEGGFLVFPPLGAMIAVAQHLLSAKRRNANLDQSKL